MKYYVVIALLAMLISGCGVRLTALSVVSSASCTGVDAAGDKLGYTYYRYKEDFAQSVCTFTAGSGGASAVEGGAGRFPSGADTGCALQLSDGRFIQFAHNADGSVTQGATTLTCK